MLFYAGKSGGWGRRTTTGIRIPRLQITWLVSFTFTFQRPRRSLISSRFEGDDIVLPLEEWESSAITTVKVLLHIGGHTNTSCQWSLYRLHSHLEYMASVLYQNCKILWNKSGVFTPEESSESKLNLYVPCWRKLPKQKLSFYKPKVLQNKYFPLKPQISIKDLLCSHSFQNIPTSYLCFPKLALVWYILGRRVYIMQRFFKYTSTQIVELNHWKPLSCLWNYGINKHIV